MSKDRMTRNDDPTCLPAALSAAATGRVSIVTGKPLFQIRNSAGDHLQDWHMAETAEGALNGYRRMLALRESARNNPRPVQEVEIMPPPAKLLIRRVPPSAAIERFDDPDEFLYHVTATWNVDSILEQGFLPDCRSTFTNYAGYTKGKLFLTERGGVPYWVEKVRNHLWHNHDNPPGVAVLRVPRAAIGTALHEDAAGAGDSLCPSYFVTVRIEQRSVTPSEYAALRRSGSRPLPEEEKEPAGPGPR